MKKGLIFTTALAMVLGVGAAVAFSSGAKQVKAADNRTFGFLDTDDWGTANAYIWGASGSKTAYPGDVATYSGKTEAEHKLFTYSFDVDTYTSLIFNNGQTGTGEKKTADLTGMKSVDNNSVYDYYNSKWVKEHSWGFCGEINGGSWVDDAQTDSAVPITATSATFTVTLKVGAKFKFRADGDWDFQLDGTTIAAQNGTYFDAVDSGQNAQVKDGKGGTYTFSINWRIEAYGDKSYGIGVTNYVPDGDTSWKMLGNGSKWVGDFVYANGLAMAVNPDNLDEVKIENVSLAAGDQFKFNNQGSVWYGYSNLKTGSDYNSCFESAGDNNLKVKADCAGSYTFFVDVSVEASGQSIWATRQDAVDADGWAIYFNTQVGCDSKGIAKPTGWSDCATEFGKLSDDAKDYVYKGTASSDPSASNLAKALATYDWAVAHNPSLVEADRFVKDHNGNVRAVHVYRNISHSIIGSITESNSNMVLLAVLIGVTSITAVGIVLVIRRRKHN